MFPTNGTSYLTIRTLWPKEKDHVIIVAADTTLHISCIFVTRSKSISPRRRAHIKGAVLDVALNTVVDVIVTTINVARAMIIRMRIEIMMKMVFKRCAMIGCAISVVDIVDVILPKPLDFMMSGSVILEFSPFHITMNIGICQRSLLVLQLALEALRKAEQSPQTNTIRDLLK